MQIFKSVEIAKVLFSKHYHILHGSIATDAGSISKLLSYTAESRLMSDNAMGNW